MTDWNLGNLVPKELLNKVYDDAVSPSAKQIGRLGEDVIKTARLLLSPLQVTAAVGDRLEAMIERIAKRVPEDRRIAPQAEIVGPVIEHMRFINATSPLSAMFEEILGKSMDMDGHAAVHPAFAQIVIQLSRDEAWLLFRLKQKEFSIVDHLDMDASGKAFKNRVVEKTSVPEAELYALDQFDFYNVHLSSLGLIEWPVLNQVPTMTGSRQTGVRRDSVIRLTDLGKMFVAATIPTEGFEAYVKT
jgi:hypothetical protein